MSNVISLFEKKSKTVVAPKKRKTRKDRKAEISKINHEINKELPEYMVCIYTDREGNIKLQHTPMSAVTLNALLGSLINGRCRD